MTIVATTGFLYRTAMSLQLSLKTKTRNNKPVKERILKQIWTIYLLRPTKKSIWFLVIGRLQNRCGDALYFLGNLFFLPTSEIRDTRLLEPDQISHTQSMVAKRGHTNQANVHTPTWKSSNQSSNFGCNFGKKSKLKMPTGRAETTRAETRNWILLFWPHTPCYS